jgi:probable HAF family extracellular repeat protein
MYAALNLRTKIFHSVGSGSTMIAPQGETPMKCTALHLCALFAMSLFAFGQNTSTLPPAEYTITDLGTLGGTTSMANAINSSGQIAGTATTAGDAASHAVRYVSGSLQDLGTLGGTSSFGNAINSLGFVAGSSQLSGSDVFLESFYWSPTSGIHDLGPYSLVLNGKAYAIDDHGHVVGGASNNFDGEDAFAWTPTKRYIDLGNLGGRAAEAHGIDSGGHQVVGLSTLGGDFNTYPFIWSSAASLHALPLFPGGQNGVALAINNLGNVAGWGDMGDFQNHAALWIKGGKAPQSLGTLGGASSTATALNLSDIVVGSSLPATGTTTHAFVWAATTGIVDLNTLIPSGSGWILTIANGVNDVGQIVGNGTINGHTHGFLLTPANRSVNGE